MFNDFGCRVWTFGVMQIFDRQAFLRLKLDSTLGCSKLGVVAFMRTKFGRRFIFTKKYNLAKCFSFDICNAEISVLPKI